jgi:hypothetical protein
MPLIVHPLKVAFDLVGFEILTYSSTVPEVGA